MKTPAGEATLEGDLVLYEWILDWEANKLDMLVGVKLLDISCIRIATDLK